MFEDATVAMTDVGQYSVIDSVRLDFCLDKEELHLWLLQRRDGHPLV